MADELRIIVLEGDETGQELLEQALRVLDPAVTRLDLRLEHYDLSLANRRRTGNEVVVKAARAMAAAGFGIKAATITPEGKDDVGSPNRILREAVDGKVIVRTGRRIPGVVGLLAGVFHPIWSLPPPLELLSRISPMRYAVDLVRGAYYAGQPEYGRVVLDPPLFNLGICAALGAVFIVLGTTLFVRREQNR